VSSLAFDLRDTLKSLRRDRSYALTVILTLALTTGATTTVFSIVNGVLIKPLAYRESHRLVALREVWRQLNRSASPIEVNEQHFEYWRAHATSFASMAQYVVRPVNLSGSGDAAQITVVRASGSLFDVLQVPAAIGRVLTSEDEREDRARTVVITDALWRQRFDADPRVVGRSIALDGTPHTVVGVLPRDFRLPSGADLTAKIDGFVAIRMASERVGWVGDHNNDALGRLKPGVTLEQARAELDVLQTQVSAIATREAHEPVILSSAVIPLAESVVGRSRPGLLLLLAAIAAVLLIACSNLANLGLTRTMGRLREASIRSALGASRARLVWRAALEQTLLSATGGVLGVWVAWAGLIAFVRTAPPGLPRVNDVTLDASVLGFATVVSIVAGLVVAMLPAWRTAGHDVQAGLRAGATDSREGLGARATLLALQIALSVTLLVVTALLGMSFARVMNIDRGFEAAHVLAIDVALPATGYAEEPVQQAAYDRILAGIHGLPGVEGATTASMLPLSGNGQTNFVAVEGNTQPLFTLPSANFRFVAPDYFRTLGIAIRRGRSFTDAERAPDRPAPAVVSEPTARQLWPGQEPVGKRFSRGYPEEQGFEVVGVAADARVTSIECTPPLMVYAPYWWRSRTSTSLLVKSSNDPTALLPAIRRVVREIDPEIAIGQSRPLEQLVETSFAARRYQMMLFLAFAGAAFLIAMMGVYAVTAYSVTRRRREMNIRAALGAPASQILGLVIRQTGKPVAIGVAAGAAGAGAVGTAVATLLFQVPGRDPWLIAGVVMLVGLAGMSACALAARRGLQINPTAALRED
jgi:predicted permease